MLERVIGVQSIRSPRLFPVIYGYLQENYPNIEVTLYEQNLLSMERLLATNEIDLFLCHVSRHKPEFEYIPIFQDYLMFMTRVNHPLLSHVEVRGGEFPWVNLSHFSQETFILHRQGSGASIRMLADKTLAAYNLKPKKILEVEHVATSMELVANGMGVGFCPRTFVDLVKPTPLALFSVDLLPKTIEFSAVHMRGKELPVYAHEVIQVVKRLFQQRA